MIQKELPKLFCQIQRSQQGSHYIFLWMERHKFAESNKRLTQSSQGVNRLIFLSYCWFRDVSSYLDETTLRLRNSIVALLNKKDYEGEASNDINFSVFMILKGMEWITDESNSVPCINYRIYSSRVDMLMVTCWPLVTVGDYKYGVFLICT